jgi:hypothetical protein
VNTDSLTYPKYHSVPPPEFSMFINGEVVNSKNGVLEFQPELGKKLMLLKYFFYKRTGLCLRLQEEDFASGLTIPNSVYHNGMNWEKMKKWFKISIINNEKTEPDVGYLVTELMSLTKYLCIYTSLEWSASVMTAMTVTNLYVDSSSETTVDTNNEIYIPYEIPVCEYYKPITKTDVRHTNSTVVTNKKKSLVSHFYEYITNW